VMCAASLTTAAAAKNGCSIMRFCLLTSLLSLGLSSGNNGVVDASFSFCLLVNSLLLISV